MRKSYLRPRINIETNFNIAFNTGRDITFLNPYSWLSIVENGYILDDFLVFADGIFLVNLYNILYNTHINRFSFDDTTIAPIVFNYAHSNNQRVLLVGGKPGIASKAAELLRLRYNGNLLIASESGYFNSEKDRNRIITNAKQFDIVIAGLGVIRQEQFLKDIRYQDWKGTGYTCGGYFDQLVLCNGNPYYPSLVDAFNIRSFYRWLKEPRRLTKRYFALYPRFLITFLKSYFSTGTQDAK